MRQNSRAVGAANAWAVLVSQPDHRFHWIASHRTRAYRLQDLVACGCLDKPIERLLAASVRAGLNIVISGDAGSGKTTMLNALCAHIPSDERVLTVEETAELSLLDGHAVRFAAPPSDLDHRAELITTVTVRDVLRNNLSLRPDRIVVGEVRGGEALDLLQVMRHGPEGALTTVRTTSADDTLPRLAALAGQGTPATCSESVAAAANQAVDLIVHLERAAGGVPRVGEVALPVLHRRRPFGLTTLACYEPEPTSERKAAPGRFRHYPVSARIATRLRARGEPIPPAFREDRFGAAAS